MRAAFLGAAAGLVLVPAAFGAARPTILVSPSGVHRGHLVRVHGSVPGCPAGDSVTLMSKAFAHRSEFAGVPAVHAQVAPDGSYSVRTRIPARRRPGRYEITGRCGGGNLGATAVLHVER